MAGTMDDMASEVHCPILVVHGGKDIFTKEQKVNDFYEHFPASTDKTKKYYPGSYHLLMYDHDRNKIFKDLCQWLTKINKAEINGK